MQAAASDLIVESMCTGRIGRQGYRSELDWSMADLEPTVHRYLVLWRVMSKTKYAVPQQQAFSLASCNLPIHQLTIGSEVLLSGRRL